MITINARKVAIVVIVGLLASVSVSAGVKLTVGRKGSYIYWLTFKDAAGTSRVTQPQRFKGKSAEVDVSELGAGFSDAKLFVMDKRTGNLAIIEYASPKDPKAAKPIQLTSEDFSYVRSVRLRAVAKDGSPIESGTMTITDGEGTEMTSVITPADEGVASFENVAAGEINVKVKTEGLTKTIDSDFELPLKRAHPAFIRDIKVAGDVNTITVTDEAKPAAKESNKPSEPAGAYAGILQFLAGLLLLLIFVVIVFIVLGAKGITMRRAMEKLGVQFPQEQTAGTQAPPSAALEPDICQFCGQKKDAAGNCACTVGPVPVTGAALSTGPKLVGTQGAYAGHVFDLKQGTTTIGREAGNDIALVDDSTTSRRHATVTVLGVEVSIRDEGSSNGTFVNGVRITEQKLSTGDEVQIGATKFRLES